MDDSNWRNQKDVDNKPEYTRVEALKPKDEVKQTKLNEEEDDEFISVEQDKKQKQDLINKKPEKRSFMDKFQEKKEEIIKKDDIINLKG